MSIVSLLESAVGTFVPNPMKWIKLAFCASLAITAMLLGYKALSYIEQAQADHASVVTLTIQMASAVETNKANVAAMAEAEVQHEAAINGALQAKDQAIAQSASLKKALEDLRHAPHTTCLPSPAAGPVLGRLRQ